MIGSAETAVRVGGVAAFAAAWLAGARGAAMARRRRPGRGSGLATGLRAMGAYAVVAVPYLSLCVALWHRLPVTLSDQARWVALVTGTVLGMLGAGAYFWGRVSLGPMYNVSSAVGSELFEHHVLIERGPYRIVRHPMYVGLICSAIGALFVYRMWTSLFMVACLPGAVVKARREDRLLAHEFGDRFERYRHDVPGWIPGRGRVRERPSPRPQEVVTTREVPRCPLLDSVRPY